MALVLELCALLACSLPQLPPDLPRAVLPKDSITLDARVHLHDQVVVKLTPGARLADPALATVIGTRATQPFFVALERELAGLRARVLAATPPGMSPPADLSLYHVVRTAGLGDARALLPRLNALPEVELAYPRERPTPPPGDILPVTASFVAQQAYHAPAPAGIDAFANQRVTGGFGRGVTVLDIEWGWWFDHEDLGVLRPGSLVGPPVFNNSYNDHGLAVVGELAADADQYGVSGITPDIRMLVATDYPQSGYSVAAAIVVGLPHLVAGDVILLEAQASTPLGLGPTEWNQADFDAIQNATRLGIITVEAAGNGGVNLDDARLNRAFDLSFRDSGAIIVGATNSGALTRASFSTYGARVDANGWGFSVASTGYGDLFFPNNDRRQSYTASFSGTSSASPIVTATVVALLGAARAQLEPALAQAVDHRVIRALLRTYGTPLIAGQGIGMRPDLAKLMAGAGLVRGLRILDRTRIGQTTRIEITPPENEGNGDAWVLLGADLPANLPLPAPFRTPLCDRLLLNPATMLALTAGAFSTTPSVWALPVPNLTDLHGVRYHMQAATLHTQSGSLCASSSAMLFVEW